MCVYGVSEKQTDTYTQNVPHFVVQAGLKHG